MRNFIFAALIAFPGIINTLLFAQEAPATEVSFRNDPVNGKPGDFISVAGGVGEEGRWVVARDEISQIAENIVSQVSSDDKRANHYSLLIYKHGVFRNAAFSARLYVKGGSARGSAGVFFKYKDPGNYYVFEVSPGEGYLSVYRMADGDRDLICRSLMNVSADRWHDVKIVCDEFKADFFLDGKTVFTTNLSQFWNGKAGFWTRGDTMASFSALSITPHKDTPIIEKIKGRFS